MARFRFLAFDLDGTLIDSARDIAGAVNHVREQMGLPPLSLAAVKTHVGHGVRNLIRGAVGVEDETRITEILRLYQPYYAEHLLDQTELYPGALDLLHRCRKQKIALGILSNKPQNFSEAILKGLQIDSLFRIVIGGEAKFAKKPDPAALLHMIKHVGATPETTCYIGDSLIDWQTGQNANVHTVLATQGFADREALSSVPAERLYPTIDSMKDFLLS